MKADFLIKWKYFYLHKITEIFEEAFYSAKHERDQAHSMKDRA
jgi:hypothetical protein